MRYRVKRQLRRRYGRAKGYRIEFGRGLVATAPFSLIPGRVYAMGASSSPDIITVDYVTGDRIGYHKRGSAPRVIERWIGEDLIARGQATFTARYGVDPQTWADMSEAQRREQLKRRI
jgi:hypothetical protein